MTKLSWLFVLGAGLLIAGCSEVTPPANTTAPPVTLPGDADSTERPMSPVEPTTTTSEPASNSAGEKASEASPAPANTDDSSDQEKPTNP